MAAQRYYRARIAETTARAAVAAAGERGAEDARELARLRRALAVVER